FSSRRRHTRFSRDWSSDVCSSDLFLQMEDPKKDIHLYINSPGGVVTGGMAIYDTINFLQCDVVTYCIGQAASMATVLLAAGAKRSEERRVGKGCRSRGQPCHSQNE